MKRMWQALVVFLILEMLTSIILIGLLVKSTYQIEMHNTESFKKEIKAILGSF